MAQGWSVVLSLPQGSHELCHEPRASESQAGDAASKSTVTQEPSEQRLREGYEQASPHGHRLLWDTVLILILLVVIHAISQTRLGKPDKATTDLKTLILSLPATNPVPSDPALCYFPLLFCP